MRTGQYRICHSRERINRNNPEIAHRLQRKKDHGRAEAILIAKFGEIQ